MEEELRRLKIELPQIVYSIEVHKEELAALEKAKEQCVGAINTIQAIIQKEKNSD